MKSKHKAVTLIELMVAVLLLSVVVMTAVTLELAVRRMQIKPAAEAKLIDELIPIIEKIEKDFQRQIAVIDEYGFSIENSGNRLVIRVDEDDSGNVSSGDIWWAYERNNNQMQFYRNDTPSGLEIIGYNITTFNLTPDYDKRSLTITVGTRKDSTNQEVNLTTTVFSRMVPSK